MVKEGKRAGEDRPTNIVVKIPMLEAGMVRCGGSPRRESGQRHALLLERQCLIAAKRARRTLARLSDGWIEWGRKGWRSSAKHGSSSTITTIETEILAASMRHPRHVIDAR